MGNPLGAAAGVATLEILQQMSPGDWAAVHARGQKLMEGLQDACSDAGVVVGICSRILTFHTAI